MYKPKDSFIETIMSASSDAFLVTSKDGIIVYASENSCKIFGFPNTEAMINKTLLSLVDSSEHDKAWGNFSMRRKGEEMGYVEYTGKKQDGTNFFICANGKLLVSEEGKTDYVVYVFKDITSEKQLGETLSQERENFQFLVENLDEIVYKIDENGIIQFISNSIYKHAGFNPEEVIGRPFYEFIYPPDLALLENINRFILDIESPPITYRYVKKDGEVLWVRTKTIPIYKDGVFKGGYGTLVNVTEIKNHEKILEDREHQLNLAQIISKSGSFDTNIITNTVNWSENNYRLLGFEPYSVKPTGELFDSFVHPEDIDLINNFHQKLLNASKPESAEYEFRLLQQDGSYRWFTTHIETYFYEGILCGVRGTNMDIHERKRAEENRRHYYKRQNLIASISHRISVSTNIVNDFQSILYIVKDHFECCVFLEFDSYSDLFSSFYSSCINSEDNCCAEYLKAKKHLTNINENRDYNLITYRNIEGISQLIATPVISENKKVGLLGLMNTKEERVFPEEELKLFRLISDSISRAIERHIILNKLKNSTIILNHFIEIAREGHWEVDIKSKRVKYNESGAKMLGYNNSEISNNSVSFWKSIVHPEDYELQADIFKKCINREISDFETLIRIKASSGEWKWILQRGSVVMRENSNIPEKIMGIHLDITEQKNAEEMLKSNLKTRDKLFSIIAHDLRGPVMSLIPMLDMYVDSRDRKENNQALLKDIKKSITHTTELLDNLLSWARLQSKSLKLNPSNFSLNQIVDEITELYASTAEVKSISLSTSVPRDTYADADVNSIKLVLRNLLNNALKYTPAGGNISIVAREERGQIVVEIEDNGIGMTEEMINNFYDSKIFSSTYGTDNEKGTGLGLALCKESIENNGGSIDVYSKLGSGTKFEFTLKKGNPEEAIDHFEFDSDSLSDILKGKRILFADDDSFSQLYISNMLLKWGAMVDIAENGKKALEKINSHNYNIIIMDVEMPVMDGFSAVRIIRNELRLDIPIIAFSSNICDEIKEEAILCGCNDYLQKPGTPAGFLEKIALCLNMEPIFFKKNIRHINSNNDGIADWNKIYDSLGNDINAIRNIIAKFLEVTPKYYKEILKSYKTRNFVKLGTISHKMKSSISLIASVKAIENLSQINTLAKTTNNIEDIRPHIDYLKKWYPELCRELEKKEIVK